MLSGAIIGGTVGLVMACIFYFLAAGMQKKGTALGKEYVVALSWTGNYRAGLDAAGQALERAGGTFVSEDSEAGLILGRTKSTVMKFGMTINIRFAGPPGAIQVEVAAANTVQKVDFQERPKAWLADFKRHWHALGGETDKSTPNV